MFKFIPPKRQAEANIQAQFYMRCKQAGISCLLEYKQDNCRFDAVVYKDDNVICLIEIKNYTEHTANKKVFGGKKTKQFEKYEAYGYPVFYIYNENYVDAVFLAVQALYPV